MVITVLLVGSSNFDVIPIVILASVLAALTTAALNARLTPEKS
jgi:hypothetical protein